MKRRQFLQNSAKIVGAAVGSSLLAPLESSAFLATASRGRLVESFVCMPAYSASIYSSRSAMSWTARNVISSSNWTSIAAGPVYCAVGSGSSYAAVSQDGITWKNPSIPSKTWNGIAWNGNVFSAVCYSTAESAYSTDGSSWTVVSMPTTAWNSITARGSTFCAVSASTSAISTNNGVSWTLGGVMTSNAGVAVASNGSVFCSVGNGSNVGYSTDGLSWSNKSITNASWSSIAYGGGIFCAVALGSNKAATSTDAGLTWTLRTLPATANWSGIAWNGSVFCATSFSSVNTATSPDGITWTSHNLPSSLSTTWMSIASKA